MSDLSFVEKNKFEKLFGMSSGYVLNFTDYTFQEFITDSVRRDIHCGRYKFRSSSKANLLRKFWEIEPNHIVSKLLNDLLDIINIEDSESSKLSLYQECQQIVERLRQGALVEELVAVDEDLDEKGFEILIKPIRTSIDNNEPEKGLDRLHTFVTKYLRHICKNKGITISEDKPLHSLLGEYIKYMKAEGFIETKMTERILKSSISIYEAFNDVRNNYSLAHDNTILNYNESLLIFNNVVNSIRFLQKLERRKEEQETMVEELEDDDLMF